MIDIVGKRVVVTGVSRGIGYALVLQYLDKGCVVAGMGRTEPDMDHPNFYFYETDIRNSENVIASFESFVNDSGGSVDILIKNAGLGTFGVVESYTGDAIAKMFETNVYGVLYAYKQVVPAMKEKGSGHIVNISSIAGLDGFPEVSVYCATKHAVRAISESTYKELRDFGVKVTCVYPGSVKTDFFNEIDSIIANDNMMMPEDVATMIVQATEMPKNFHQVNLEITTATAQRSKKIRFLESDYNSITSSTLLRLNWDWVSLGYAAVGSQLTYLLPLYPNEPLGL